MARPTTTRRSVRVQAPSRPASPQLGVYAPLEVQTPGAGTDALAGLGEILGVAAGIGTQVKNDRDAAEFAAGQADEKLGEADVERAERSRKYADGAYEVSILEQQQDAERVVSEKIASELDRSLPLNQQLAVIDGWMKSELGPLVADDRAKLIIAPRYQEFIDTVGANILNAQVEDRAKRAVEVSVNDAAAEIQRSGSLDWAANWQRIVSQTGDGAGATSALVDVVAQDMIRRATSGDPNWASARDAIPTEITGPDGKTVRGPMHSPKHADTIHRATLQAEQLFHKAKTEQYAGTEFQARVTLDEMLGAGLPITEATFKSLGYTVGSTPDSTLSPALAASYIQASQVAAQKAAGERAEMDGWLNARRVYGRWADTTGLPGGPESAEKTQKAFDGWAQAALAGSGTPIEQLGGAGLIADPALVSKVAALSAQEGLPYTPLKRVLSEVNQAAPGDVLARVEAYKVVKARGLSSMYVDDASALIYETAIGAMQSGTSDPEAIAEVVRTMGDKATAAHVATNMRDVKVRTKGFEVPAGTKFFGLGTGFVNSKQTQNAGYLHTKYEQLTAAAVAKGLPLERAEAYAAERLTGSHTALPVGDSWLVLPNTAIGDPKVATEALEWYVADQLPKVRERLKVPESDTLTVQGRYDINGRAVQFEVLRDAVPTGVVFGLDGLVSTYRRVHPRDVRAGVEAMSVAEQARKAAVDEAYRDNPALSLPGLK